MTKFLGKTLSAMGILPKEHNDFIVLWLPYMQDYPNTFINFQKEVYTDKAKLR